LGGQIDSKDLATAAAYNLLDHYLKSTTELLDAAMKNLDKMKLLVTEKVKLETGLNEIHRALAHLSANPKSRQDLRFHINKMIKQIRRKYPLLERTRNCITNVLCAINRAIEGTFGFKEDIQSKAIVNVLAKIGVMRTESLVPAGMLNKEDEE
jgi:hypothetical protein